MANEPTHLRVLISGGFSGAYERLLPEFERVSGIKVATASGASQGKGPQTIAAQLVRGDPADVVILSREGLTELIVANRIAAGTDVDLARVPLGIAVAAGAGLARSDVVGAAALGAVMLKAKAVAVPASTSGIWLTTVLFQRLGIADRINVKMMPRGTDATRAVADGAADVGVLPVSEIAHDAGVVLAGRLAPEIQFIQTFSAAVVARSKQVAAAKRLIAFLASVEASEAIAKSGMEPLAVSK